jgi:hypothetical protein
MKIFGQLYRQKITQKYQGIKSKDYLVIVKIENNYQKYGSFATTHIKDLYQKVNFMFLYH